MSEILRVFTIFGQGNAEISFHSSWIHLIPAWKYDIFILFIKEMGRVLQAEIILREVLRIRMTFFRLASPPEQSFTA